MKNSKFLQLGGVSAVLITISLIVFSCNQDNAGEQKTEAPKEMTRTAINPEPNWGAAFMMHQAEVIENASRTVHFSGQVSIKADSTSEMGVSVVHADDMGMQMKYILENIDELLGMAGMDRSNVTHVNFYPTNMGDFLANYGVYAEWIAQGEVMPTQTAVQVAGLVAPGLVIEIEIQAAE